MSFQLDEKMMAENRAIITRNKTESDLFVDDKIKFKPGMMHYVSDTDNLFLSIKPMVLEDGTLKTITKVILEKDLDEIINNILKNVSFSEKQRDEIKTIAIQNNNVILSKEKPDTDIDNFFWFEIIEEEEE